MSEPTDHLNRDESESQGLIPPSDDSGAEDSVSSALEPSPHDERVAELMSHTIDVPILASAVDRQEAPDAADTLERLEEEDEAAAEVLHEMEDLRAAEALAEMEPALAEGVLKDLIEEDPAFAGHLLEVMADDDAADLLQSLDEPQRGRLLKVMEHEPARDLVELSKYDPESAGGIMTTDYLAVFEDMTVKQAINHLRGHGVSEHIQNALVIDRQEKLTGIIALYRMLLSDPSLLVRDIKSGTVRTVQADMDREAVAREFDRYDYAMLPVVDEGDRPRGIVTVDDVIDIIRAEQTEDVQKTVGAGAREAVYSHVVDKFKGRFPWLLMSLFMMIPAALIIQRFEGLISEAPVLAVLMVVIAALVGNAGHQALAVTQRGLVLDEVRPERVVRLLVREGLVGLLNGSVLGSLIVLGVGLLALDSESASWNLGFVTGIGAMFAISIGTLFGSAIPLLMKRLGFDPAQSSAIILIMITDAVAFGTILSLALLIYEKTQLVGQL